MPRPKMTDEQYLERYGYTREESEVKKKERQKTYNKKYQAKLRKRKGTKKRGRKKGTKVAVREKIVPVKAHLHSGATLPMLFNVEDLFYLEQIRIEINELHAGAINKYIVTKINERNNRRNSNA